MNLFVFYFLPSHLSARKKIFFEIFKFSVDERGGRRRNFIAFIEKRKNLHFIMAGFISKTTEDQQLSCISLSGFINFKADPLSCSKLNSLSWMVSFFSLALHIGKFNFLKMKLQQKFPYPLTYNHSLLVDGEVEKFRNKLEILFSISFSSSSSLVSLGCIYSVLLSWNVGPFLN